MKEHAKKIFLILGVILILGVGVFLFFFDHQNKLTAEEKKWISEKKDVVQNVSILNDTNVFGNLGEGIYYTFLNDFTKQYEIKINPVTIKKDEISNDFSFTIGDYLPENAFSFFEDYYVLVGKTEELINDFELIKNRKIGILNSSALYIRTFFGSNSNQFTEYNTMIELITAFDNGEVQNIVIPRLENMDSILSKNYWINYHIGDLKRVFYVQDASDSTLYHIVKKYFLQWQEKNLENLIYEQERKFFIENLNISKTALDDIQKSTLSFGFMKEFPFNTGSNSENGGILWEIMHSFARFLNVDFSYNFYKNDKKIIKDFNDKKIDFYFNYKNTISNGATIRTSLPLSFDVYVHESLPITIHSLETLKKYTIYVEENTILSQKLSTIDGLQVKTYSSLEFEKLVDKEDSIFIMDHFVGEYLEKSTLKHYVRSYHYDYPETYVIRSMGNETLNLLLSKYMNFLDMNVIARRGMYQSRNSEIKGSFFNSLAHYLLYAIVIILVILFLIYRSSKNVRMQKKLKKEDKLKLIDQLTSLKNRNYLTENLGGWNKNTIYPQSVVMIDLNRIQEINDTLGYEEGDKQIKGAANILIRSQLDNTDMIRTNGNEFMIYLVGYNQKQITSYIHKLNKEFRTLPYPYGSAISYSMILDDLKSIEDAINECVEDIKKQKEEQKDEKND